MPKDLIEYDETIAVCEDSIPRQALVLRNYSKHPRFKVLGPMPNSFINPGDGRPQPNIHERKIGQLFDAVDIVRFQQAIMESADDLEKRRVEAHSKDYFEELFRALGKRASGLGRMASVVQGFVANPRRPIQSRADQDYDKYGELVSGRDPSQKFTFKGYFPEPRLILEEERTKLGKNGKTDNNDARKIEPIDALMLQLPSIEGHKSVTSKFLYEELALPMRRIRCFAFRGDDRDPETIFRADGFLAGATRTDEGAFTGWDEGKATDKLDPVSGKKVRDLAQEIDAARTDPEAYSDLVRKHYLNLKAFLKDQTFKAFLSTTKSMAIAKCFANYWDKSPCEHARWGSPGIPGVRDNYCYAVRCNGGIEVQRDEKKHEIASFLEQEVTMVGVIWKEDIVGFRRIHTNNEGQFLSGPIFLQDRLREIDPKAFDRLFKLFSGKSQGENAGIEKSYPDAPWRKNSWPIA
jgi:hypothetical protein